MRWIVLAFALLFSTGASAQCSGVIPNGYICGNLSGSQNVFAAYPFANFSCIFGCDFGNGIANGARWNSSLGSADAALYESPGNNFIAQTGLSGTFGVTDQNGNFLFSAAGPVPQAQGGTTNGNNYSFQSNICSIADEDFTVSGTPTATESPGFTYKVGSTTVTITYTVQPGDTNNNITAGLVAAVKNSVAMAGIINGTCPNGNYYNGTATSVQFSSTGGGFDVIYTADPNLAGNAWTAINTVHTTITLTPVSTFGGQPGEIWSAFIPGRDAVSTDNVYVGSYIFQDGMGAAATYLTDQLTVLSSAPGAVTFQRQWTGGGCGFGWSVAANTASSFQSVNCDLSLIANSSPGNNINMATGATGAVNITPGSGGVHINNVPLGIASGGTGAATASAARTSLGVVPGTGLTQSGNNVNSNATVIDTYTTGDVNAVVTGKGGYTLWPRGATVDNLAASSATFTCSGNPTITYYECGTDVSCASPTTIGAITLAASGRAYANSTGLSAISISAGDFTAWALTAGTCSAIDVIGKAQIHMN